MKIYSFILIVFCWSTNLYSQSIGRSTVGSGGSSQQLNTFEKSYFVSQSIGQASVIGTSFTYGYVIRQGFQQPPYSFVIGEPKETSDLSATIYPNPFVQSIHISFEEITDADVSVVVHDIAGRLILAKNFEAAKLITVPLASLASGDYILNVSTGTKHLSTSLIKQ